MKFTQRSIHSKSNHRYKILVSAYACEPDKGSEPGVGWHWVEAISQKNEVWVLTKRNNRSSIEKELNNNPNPHLHFEYVDLPNWLTFWKKGQRGIRTYYYLWQFAALFRARSLHRNIGFDLGHHVTFVNDWLWTFFAFMPLPFIWGPIGSNPKTPANLLPHVKAKLFDLLRFLFQGFMRCIDPLYWISALRAQVVMTINEQNAGLFPLRLVAKNKIKIVPAIATEINDNSATNIETHEGFYVLFVGRFVSIKAPHLAVEAFARFLKKRGDAKFVLIGHGPEERDLRQRVEEYGITENVKFVPWLDRCEVLTAMQGADVFFFPSMEGGGMVVLEAMAAGLPVVCLDFGGPGAMVSDEVGIKVKIGNQSEVVDGLVSALDRLAVDKGLRKTMGDAARKMVAEKFCWENKADIVESIIKNIY